MKKIWVEKRVICAGWCCFMSLKTEDSRLYSLNCAVWARISTSFRTNDLRFHSSMSFRSLYLWAEKGSLEEGGLEGKWDGTVKVECLCTACERETGSF